MKQKLEKLSVEIISEPSDGTRYHYYLIEGEDAFYFAGVNELHYPKQIAKASIIGLNAEKISVKHMREFLMEETYETQFLRQVAKENGGANIWTIAECVRSALEELCEKN
jgi:hypothetical protein